MRREKIITSLFVFLFSISILFFAAPNRDRWQQPERVMDEIGVKEGMIIGEAGVGQGYFTFKLARRVGPNGKVYANEINPDYLEEINLKCREKNITNIETILGEENDPLFPDGTLDMVVMVYVFHHLQSPTAFLESIKQDLKYGATVVIIEQDPQKTGSSHFFPRKHVIELIKMANYQIEKILEFLEKDTIYILKKNNPTTTAKLWWDSMIRQ